MEKGFGVRATGTIKRYTFIVEYIGDIISAEQNELLSKRHRDRYVMRMTDELFIDAERKGNVSRLINHSCLPNAEAKVWIVDTVPRVIIRARKKIASMEEITINYGDDYSIPDCLCNACKGDNSKENC